MIISRGAFSILMGKVARSYGRCNCPYCMLMQKRYLRAALELVRSWKTGQPVRAIKLKEYA